MTAKTKKKQQKGSKDDITKKCRLFTVELPATTGVFMLNEQELSQFENKTYFEHRLKEACVDAYKQHVFGAYFKPGRVKHLLSEEHIPEGYDVHDVPHNCVVSDYLAISDILDKETMNEAIDYRIEGLERQIAELKGLKR